jgi:DNA-binding PadR family transcriptional regulator
MAIRRSASTLAADTRLPLRTNWFHILLCLADGEQHGYGIMQEVLARTGGKVRLWPATLYGTLRRLIEEGLIEEADNRRDPDADDVRRRYYRLSRRGRRALTEEIARLEDLVRAARVKGRALKLGESS